MTSQKSLKNNVNKNDFKRSFLGSLPFPVIAFLALFILLTIPVIQYVTADEFVRAKEHLEYTMFIATHSTFYYSFELLPIGMVVCGMLTALKSFSYLLSKKQVNVYLSLGVKRKTLVTNRMVSGVLLLFLAVFVPILIIYITNAVSFGMSAHLTELFMYFVSLLFVCGLTGFSLVSAMIMASGNIFEAVFSSIALSVLPVLAIATADSLIWGYLKGFISAFSFTPIAEALTPWTMAVNMQEEYLDVYMDGIYDYSNLITPKTILRLITKNSSTGEFKLPAEYSVDWGFILPVVIWLVISVILIGVTYYLFNKRKAEHANSLGKFPVSRAVVGTCAFMGITFIFSEWFGREYSISVLFVITVALGLLAYFLVQLILTRKPKTALKSMKWSYVLVGTLAVFSILINTQLLGTYNKIPDKADVKSVTIQATELAGYPHWIYPWEPGENFVESSTDESKQSVLKVYELLKNEKTEYDKECLTNVTLGIRDNDGKVKYRRFDIFSEETYMKYIQLVYGSDYFDAILKTYLVDDVPENTHNDSTGYLKTLNWSYTDSDMIIEIGEEPDFITDVDGLCEALYKDLSKMSVEELFKNNNQPVCVLTYSYYEEGYSAHTPAYSDYVYYPESVSGSVEYIDGKVYEEPEFTHSLISEFIPVYENMTNTLNFLKENGYELKAEPMKIKEVLYTDESMPLSQAKIEFGKANEDSNRGWDSAEKMFPIFDETMFRQTEVSCYSCDILQYFIEKPETEYDLIKRAYKDAGHPLTSVTDTEKMQEIIDKTVSQYLTLNDEGRYVYVLYEEGVIVCYYLPEANLSVIK